MPLGERGEQWASYLFLLGLVIMFSGPVAVSIVGERGVVFLIAGGALCSAVALVLICWDPPRR